MRHRRNNEKPKNFKESMKNLFFFLKPFSTLIIISVLLASISSIFSIIGPDKIKEITNTIVSGLQTGINLDKIKSISLFLLIIYLLSFIFNYFSHFIMATVTNKFVKDLRLKISKKINKLPLKYFDNNSYGDILSRITNDVDTMSSMINQSIASLISNVTLLIGSLVMMFYTNYILAFTAILASLFGFFFMIIVLSKSQKYFNEFQEELGNLNGQIEETYTGHNIVKVYNGYEKEVDTFDSINSRMFNSSIKSHFYSGLMPPFMGFIGNFSYVLVCVVGSYLAINNYITFGVIIAFTIYARLFTQPLSNLAQTLSSFQSAGAASERVFEFLNEEEMESEKKLTEFLDKDKVKGKIEFKNVSFGYNTDKLIIKNFNASIKPGMKVAIVGETGAGKTTLVNLLMKFYNITSGDILIDSLSIKSLTRENIHDLFIMVLQDTWTYEGTIYENIVYNKKDVDIDDVRLICKKIGLHHIIKSLSHGYDTKLTDSETLSAGEKQLLTIARGMVKNSPFLILDEATSSVDTRTEELVSRAMDNLCKGRTSFVIAHRLSTIKNADLILVLKDGNIIEQGNHEELLNQDGYYKNLYNSQFESIE